MDPFHLDFWGVTFPELETWQNKPLVILLSWFILGLFPSHEKENQNYGIKIIY